jgi:hypothetical protein
MPICRTLFATHGEYLLAKRYYSAAGITRRAGIELLSGSRLKPAEI